MPVPQFRDGECHVRQLWDFAVCAALGLDEADIAGLRKLLHANRTSATSPAANSPTDPANAVRDRQRHLLSPGFGL